MRKSRSFRRNAMKLRTRFAGVSARVLGTLLAGSTWGIYASESDAGSDASAITITASMGAS